jgi:hypothetical protein
LLTVVVRGQKLPPLPDADAQRHFAAGLARFRDGAETFARTEDDAEVLRRFEPSTPAMTSSREWSRRLRKLRIEPVVCSIAAFEAGIFLSSPSA